MTPGGTGRALVTGGTGFIGGRLVMSLLAAGHQVRALVRPGADGARLEAAGAELASGSLSANVARCFDLARARRDLGYDPVIAAQEGMAGLVAWYRAEGLLDAVD